MKFLIDLISEQLSGAFEKAGFDAAYGRATLSNGRTCANISATVRWQRQRNTKKHLL